MANTDGRYVQRSTSAARGGFVVYTVVDMAGQPVNIALPRHLTTSELANPVLMAAVAGRRHAPPVVPCD